MRLANLYMGHFLNFTVIRFFLIFIALNLFDSRNKRGHWHLFGSSIADRARYGWNKFILETISSVLNLLPPEAYLINHFFTPPTSLILLADQNIYFWIRSITSGVHSERIWDSGSLVERYPDPALLLKIYITAEGGDTEKTWSWYPSNSNWAMQSSKKFNQGQCYGWAKSFLQRSISTNLLLHRVAFNMRNEPFLDHSQHTISCSCIIWLILLMWTSDSRIICFPWVYFSNIRRRAIKQSWRKLDSRRLGTRWVGASERLGSKWLGENSDWGVSVADRAIREQGIGEQVIGERSNLVRIDQGAIEKKNTVTNERE